MKNKEPAPPEKGEALSIIDEPGMVERFQRGLQRALNTPPKHRTKAKERAAHDDVRRVPRSSQ